MNDKNEQLKPENQARQIYFNPAQQEVILTGARDTISVMGRGCGKGAIHAAINLRNFQAMPGSTTAFVGANAKRVLSNTLPSMLEHWERWGYKRGVHWVIGRRPPKNLHWGLPLIQPENWENVISFYNGSCGVIISQDQKGTSNSKSFDFVDIDEAKFVDFEQLKDETFQANRGQLAQFGDCPWHHGMLITSDIPVTKKGSWFLKYENEATTETNEVIQALVCELYRLRQMEQDPDCTMVTLHKRILEAERLLRQARSHAVFYKRYSSLYNYELLGEEFFRRARRDLPPLTFQTSILCEPIAIMKDGFYSSMLPSHEYTADEIGYLDNMEYDFEKLGTTDSRADADIQPDQPLCIAFDYNAHINWLVVGQPDETRRRLNTLKSFFVKYERKLPELLQDFDQYYHYLKRKEVIFYYDHTALGSNYAVNNEDYRWVIVHGLRRLGWLVRPVYIGRAMNHLEKHLLINRAFSGRTRLMPFFNQGNNEDLLIAIHTAGVYNGKKDKRGEKIAETEEDKLENRTDGTDAWDTLYIGCEKFPQRSVILPVTSDF